MRLHSQTLDGQTLKSFKYPNAGRVDLLPFFTNGHFQKDIFVGNIFPLSALPICACVHKHLDGRTLKSFRLHLHERTMVFIDSEEPELEIFALTHIVLQISSALAPQLMDA